jgi:hypothetical protein
LPLVVACLGAVLVAPPTAGPGRPVPGVSGRVDDQVGEEVGDPVSSTTSIASGSPGSTLASAATRRSSLVVTNRDDQTVAVPHPVPAHRDVHGCWAARRRECQPAGCASCRAHPKGGPA